MPSIAFVLFAACVAATALEATWAHTRGLALTSKRELFADLSCAAVSFGVVALHRGAYLALYATVHARFGLHWPACSGTLAWLATFVLYDIIYYFDHRSTHTFAPLWASHAVHHQANTFHLLTGLRMSVVGPLLGYPFRLPLALLGVAPALYVSVDVVHALLTYFSHSRFVGSLGVLGSVLNTPAHHRVHHSADARHFGKNFGGVLLVWDRFFGTYAAPVPVHSFGGGSQHVALGPLRAHMEPIAELLAKDAYSRNGRAE